MTIQPKKLTDRDSRKMAREMRDGHWAFMERLEKEGTVHVCVWNKYDQEELSHELRLSLISGMELMEWFRAHQDWFEIGEQDRERWTNPINLTEAGLKALTEKEKYDMEPAYGGLVEPGFQCIPLPPEETIQ